MSVSRPTTSPYVSRAGHAYFMLGNLEEENRINSIMRDLKVAFYTLVGDTTPVDTWAGKYFRDQKFHYATEKLETSRYFGVYGDSLYEYQVPAEHAQKIDRIFARAKRYEDLDMVALITLLRQEIDIKFTVMRNPLLAEELQKSVLAQFKK
jgi:hypothetical protein